MSSRRSRQVCLMVVLAAVAGCRQEPAARPASPPPSAPRPTAPPAPAAGASRTDVDTPPAITDADIPPLPVTPFPAARPMEVVRAVYVFAARHPEVLSRMPCFCGCENRGHRQNDDCFVAARDGRGRPTAWEPHGVG